MVCEYHVRTAVSCRLECRTVRAESHDHCTKHVARQLLNSNVSPGSSPVWKLIGNPWPGMKERKHGCNEVGFFSVWPLCLCVLSTHVPPFTSCICALILEGGGVLVDAETQSDRVSREP